MPVSPHSWPLRGRLSVLPWSLLALVAAIGLSLSLTGVASPLRTGVGFATLTLRVFALVIGAVGTVRHLRRRPAAGALWLGLPVRDWGFSACCAGLVALVVWMAA